MKMVPFENGIMDERNMEILTNTNRRKIYQRIVTAPGIYFRKLQRELNIQQGVLSYHLHRLEREQLIRTSHEGKYLRYFPYQQRSEPSMLLSFMQTLILNTIRNEPGITQSNISRIIGRNKVLIHYHVKLLEDADLIWTFREGRESRCYSKIGSIS